MMKQPGDKTAGADPFDLARKTASLAGTRPIRDMQRLASFLASDEGELKWRGEFSRLEQADGSQEYWLTLTLQATLPVPCALCGEPVTVPLDDLRRFLFVRDEETAARLDEEAADFDVIAADEHFELSALIEDEAILAIPLLCKHEACPGESDGAGEAPEVETRQPFAGLSALVAGARGGETDDDPSDN